MRIIIGVKIEFFRQGGWDFEKNPLTEPRTLVTGNERHSNPASRSLGPPGAGLRGRYRVELAISKD